VAQPLAYITPCHFYLKIPFGHKCGHSGPAAMLVSGKFNRSKNPCVQIRLDFIDDSGVLAWIKTPRAPSFFLCLFCAHSPQKRLILPNISQLFGHKKTNEINVVN